MCEIALGVTYDDEALSPQRVSVCLWSQLRQSAASKRPSSVNYGYTPNCEALRSVWAAINAVK
jgi:hypothetical protein